MAKWVRVEPISDYGFSAPDRGSNPFDPTESNPLTFPASETRQICTGGRARPAPSMPGVGLSKCREGKGGLGLTSSGSRACQGFFRGCQDPGPMALAAMLSPPPMLSPPCSQGPCSLSLSVAGSVSLWQVLSLSGRFSQVGSLSGRGSLSLAVSLGLSISLAGSLSQADALSLRQMLSLSARLS